VSVPRREHHRALNTLSCDVHAAFTALLKAGVTRRREVEKHGSAQRIASPGLHPNDPALRAHTLLEQFAIRLFRA
jgi:hypothetical protein